MATLQPLPHISVPVIDPETGIMTDVWYRYFVSREKIGLGNLADVSATAPDDGNVLTYSTASRRWEPA